MDDETSTLLCHRCGKALSAGHGSFYVVRIEAIADPTPPAVDPDEPLSAIASDIDGLIDELHELSERELMDQVHRRLTLHLCRKCYQRWIEDPVR